jgi:hypothetical protein
MLGEIKVSGQYRQTASGVLGIELGGFTPVVEYDKLAVTGATTFSGTLNVSLVNGYYPPVGTVFTIVTHGYAYRNVQHH